MKREVEEEIGVGVRAEVTVTWVNEEGEKLIRPDPVWKGSWGPWMTGKAFFLVLFLLSQSLCIWAPFFSTLHFCGHFLRIVDSRQLRSILQTLPKPGWPRNEMAITVPSIVLTLGWMSAFYCVVGGRENLFLLSQNWENQGFMSLQEGGTSRITKSSCHTTLSTLCLPPLSCAEGHKEPFTLFRKRSCINFECVRVKRRSFTMRKVNWFSNIQALQECSCWLSVSSYFLGRSLGVIFEWRCKVQDPGAVLQKIIFWG